MNFKQIFPHLFALVLFFVLSYSYFSPLLEGQKLEMSDITHFRGMAKEAVDYREEKGEEALWINNMFSGMPANLISIRHDSTLFSHINKLLQVGPRPASYLIIMLIGFYFALLVFGVNRWLSIVGAIAFGFSSYFFIIMEAGHASKAVAIAYLPPLIASIYMAFRKNLWAGVVLTGFFLALEIRASHPQITYYAGLITLVLGVVEIIRAYRENTWKRFSKTVGLLLLAVVLAIGSNISKLWSYYEYGEYSMRGGSELSKNTENTSSSGLDKDYITNWSYGIDETLTLLIPNFKGSSSHGKLGTSSETYKTLKQNNVPPQRAREIIKQLPLYHGSRPFTSGPVYFGAITILFFVFALFVIKGPLKWWLLAATILSIVLAWGKNFMWLTELFIDYFPGYNKFRTVSMILVIANFTIPVLGFLGVNKLIRGGVDKNQFMKAFKYSVFIIGGVTLFFALFPGFMQDFTSPADARLPEWLRGTIREDRVDMLRSDAFRSFVLV
ncbi:MAG: hypothetical protein ACOCUV_01790, partial [bacterium]